MSGRLQALLIGPIAVLLPIHAAGLVVWECGIMPRASSLADLWVPWHLAAPILLLMACGLAMRRASDDDAADPSHLARLPWTVAVVDLLLTVVFGALLWRAA